MSNMIEELRKQINDPKFLAELVNQCKLENEIKDTDFKRLSHLFENDNTFQDIIEKLIKKHDDNYCRRCYKKGFQPYPNNILTTIVDYIFENTEFIPSVRNVIFPTETHFYRNFYFENMYGQGTILTIYDKDKNPLLTI